MGVDTDLADILHEIVQFLESLCDIDLPLKIENARDNLLQRSRTKLSTFVSSRGSTSPYLDMNAGKSLLLFPVRKEIEIQEYVGVEEQPASSPPSHQDYYENFQEIDKTITDKNKKAIGTTATTFIKLGCEEEAEDKLLETYKTFTPAMTMNKAHKFGPLDHKVERKSFGFVRSNIRSCWIGLIGSHLLIYNGEKDKQPVQICSIRGYMGRPASKSIFKDQEHAKSVFELFCPGNKTLQFIAKTPKEMKEWLTAISSINLSFQDRDSGMYERSEDKKIPDNAAPMEERYQDVGRLLPSPKHEELAVLRTTSPVLEIGHGNQMTRSDSEKKNNSVAIPATSPPALPIRLPRMLPSIPNEEALVPYEPPNDGCEQDDIYDKIEDFRDNGRGYENVNKKASKRGKVKNIGKKKEEKNKKMEESPELETYDDVENKHMESQKGETKKTQRIPLLQDTPPKEIDAMETYDSIQTIAQNTQTYLICNAHSPRRDHRESCDASNENNIRSSFTTYDDVLQPSSIVSIDSHKKMENCETRESKVVAATSAAKIPKKSPQKRSFLDRIRHREDSPKKEDKKKVEGTADNGKKREKKEKTKASLVSTPQTSGKVMELDLRAYEDVSKYLEDQNSQNDSHGETIVPLQVDDLSNYNCPPPPRPIYAKSLNSVIDTNLTNDREIIEDVYDDIANFREDNTEIEYSAGIDKAMVNDIVTGEETESVELNTAEKPIINTNASVLGNSVKSATRVSTTIDKENYVCQENKLLVDTEHYQIPRADNLRVNPYVVAASEEQLYDDIAILTEFRAKQRDSGSSSHDIRSVSLIATVNNLTINRKKPSNIFGNGKKVTTRDHSTAQTTTMKIRSDGNEVNDPSIEKTDLAKPNKLQKLINKMENTLGKQPSVKSVTPLSNKKHNGE